jgi:hypothetical protein
MESSLVMAKSGFRLEKRKLQANVDSFNDRANKAVGAAFEYQAPKSEARMRVTAPWTDRTGNARSGLFTRTRHARTLHELFLSHGASYGIYLENRFSGRYATVRPEIPRAGEDLMRIISKLFKTLPKR